MGPGFESLKVHQTKPYPNFSGKALFFVSRRFELRSRRRGFFYARGHLIACPRGLPPPAESCRGLPLAGNGKFPEGAPELPDFKPKMLKIGLFFMSFRREHVLSFFAYSATRNSISVCSDFSISGNKHNPHCFQKAVRIIYLRIIYARQYKRRQFIIQARRESR